MLAPIHSQIKHNITRYEEIGQQVSKQQSFFAERLIDCETSFTPEASAPGCNS